METLERYFEALRRHDWAGLAGTLHEAVFRASIVAIPVLPR